jgi:hypothetical protein
MAGSIRILIVSISLTAAAGQARLAHAQGGIPLGSTTIVGPADSAFSHFLAFLRAHGDSATAVDSKRHRIEARVEGSDEPVIFEFQTHGDSTTIAAQGKKGGMAALIMGLGIVNEWLEGRNGAKPDSSPH